MGLILKLTNNTYIIIGRISSRGSEPSTITMSAIQFIAPTIHKLTYSSDYVQWSKTLYLALSLMGWERFILEDIDYTDATPQLIAQRNMVMLTIESSISDTVKTTLNIKGYDNTSLDPKILFDQAYKVFYARTMLACGTSPPDILAPEV